MEDGPKFLLTSQNIWTLREHRLHCKNKIRFTKNLVQIKYLTEIEVGLLIGGVISKWDCHDTRSRIENWSKKHDMGSSNIFHEMCYFNHLGSQWGPKFFWPLACLVSMLDLNITFDLFIFQTSYSDYFEPFFILSEIKSENCTKIKAITNVSKVWNPSPETLKNDSSLFSLHLPLSKNQMSAQVFCCCCFCNLKRRRAWTKIVGRHLVFGF